MNFEKLIFIFNITKKLIYLEQINMANLVGVTKNNQTENLLCNMQYSDFGEIKKIMSSIFTPDELKNEYKLPKILMIGGESTGKSSVLENITKCHIFPRDSRVCTKSPVRILLHNNNKTLCTIIINDKEEDIKESKIYEHIEQYMNSLKDVTDKEIIINISKKNYPNLELYDLPGIVAYPPEKSKKSIDLVKKYLQEDNSIIICTIPACSERINSHSSISLIKEFKRETDTILVLTKIDKVHGVDIKLLIADRIFKMDDEVKELEIPFCIGVQNRTHDDNISLLVADDIEINTINHIINYIHSDADCKEYSKKIKNITHYLGIDNLLTIICNKYMSYVSEKWIPKIIGKINDNINLLIVELNDIGYIFNYDSFNALIKMKLHYYLHKNIRTYVSNYNNLLLLNEDIKYMNSNINIIKNHITNINIDKIIDNTINEFITIDEILYDNIICTNLKIYRYDKAINIIKINLKNELISNYQNLLDSVNNLIIIYQFAHIYHNTTTEQTIFDKFIISNLLYTIEDCISINIPKDQIVESFDILDKRYSINNKINVHKNNIKKLLQVKADSIQVQANST